MLDHRLRAEFEKGIRPIGAGLGRSGFTADQITVAGLAVSLFTGVAIATGHFFWAAVGMALCGITDVLDGAVAKSHGTAGPRGAFFDSVCDRVSDGLVLGGAAWYLAGTSNPRMSVLAFAVAGLSFLISYLRSKAEGLGLNGKGGIAERAERMVVLGLGLAFGALVPALWVLLVITAITVGQRFTRVWKQAPAPARAVNVAPAGAERRPAWWLTPRSATDDESRVARWRSSARPGTRSTERGSLTRWLASARPQPRSGESLLARWKAGVVEANEDREARRRLRARNRP
jgi:CDP-diacylglycerol--glycerol-3-phosphate 3-phosphatidyltransferase